MTTVRPPLLALSPWTILHIPHDSCFIPRSVLSKLKLNDRELDRELLNMTDFWTFALYANGVALSQTVIAPVSRLVTDVERFVNDREEPMSQRGMGVIYTTTSLGRQLRDQPTSRQRNQLIETWYRPHHQKLTALVKRALNLYGRALIIDAHSFASRALPYEDSQLARPEICIGTDAIHTPKPLIAAAMDSFSHAGLHVEQNSPFSGALTPIKHYGKDSRVHSIMIETRRDLYEDEKSGQICNGFVRLSRTLQRVLCDISYAF